MVIDYNTNKGGCDLSDMLSVLYRVEHKCMIWYKRIFLWALHLTTINAWLLYLRHSDQRQISRNQQKSLIEFIANISESLTIKSKVPIHLNPIQGNQSSHAAAVIPIET